MARIRTFIAIPLDPPVRDRLVAAQRTLARTGAEVKWVESANLHITLLFLGEVGDREVLDVCRSVGRVAAETAPIALTLESFGCFPNIRRPRVLWAGLGEGREEMIALHDALESPLLDLGCYRREERGYTPHATLGRLQGDAEPPTELLAALGKPPTAPLGYMTAREVQVLSSELRPDGPEYTVMSRAKLGG